MGTPNERSDVDTRGYDFHFPSGDYSGYLPFNPMNDDVLLSYDTQTNLAAMNDEGKTFAEIADYIEEHL
jgi:hypothetical protein